MTDDRLDLVDWTHFERSWSELGANFIRILNYFREDGAKGLAEIEAAMHEGNTVGLVLPAHTLKGESRQIGATLLADTAEIIEQTARSCIETHRFPDELVADVVRLRQRYTATMELFDLATNPLQVRRNELAERGIANQDFGRL